MSLKIILHIDDDDDDLQLIKEAIEQEDTYAIKQFSNGKEGLKYLEQAKALDTIPVLIILDMNMPVLNGKEMVKRIKEDEVIRRIPLIIFTSSAKFADQEFCKKYAVPLFVKPFMMKDFKGLVQEMLNHSKVTCL
jgi:CheY-like chemotaxis protein